MTDFVKEALAAEKAMNKALTVKEGFRATEAMKRALEKEKPKPSERHRSTTKMEVVSDKI